MKPHNKIPVFILSYRGLNYMDGWFRRENYSDNLQFYIVDNGPQEVPEKLRPMVVHQTTRNIGCAGGYNLMMHIGFDYFNFPKIVIAQDDGKFTEELITRLFDETTDAEIVGAYGNGFALSLHATTKVHRDTVGRWDENFLYSRCEDNDFNRRCELANVSIRSLKVPAAGNVSVIHDPYVMSFHANNISYIHQKWGASYQYATPFNDPTLSPFADMPFTDSIQRVYGPLTEYPSITEFNRFILNKYND